MTSSLPDLPNLPYTRGNPHARIVFVGEAPGEDEEKAFTAGRSDTAFVGSSGGELDRMCLDAGIDTSNCYFTNVCKERPPGNNLKSFNRQQIFDWIDVLHKELNSLPNATVIVPVGNLALQATTGIQTIVWNKKSPDKIKTLVGIGTHRGSIYNSVHLGENLRRIKTIPTYHPAFVQRQWSYRVTVIADLTRVAEESRFPELRLPEHRIIIDPSLRDVLEAIEISKGTDRIATDIENLRSWMFCVGIAWSNNDAICIPFMWPDGSHYWDINDELKVLTSLSDLLSNHKGQVGQFYYHDCYYYHHYSLIEALKSRFDGCLWDTFSQHVCLYGELPHSLAYLCSIYSKTPYYKAEGRTWKLKDKKAGVEQFWTYNGKDCVVTREISYQLEDELREFGRLDFYDQYYRKLFPHLLQSSVRGVRIDETVRSTARIEYKAKWTKLQGQLQRLAKKPMDLHPGDNHTKWKSDPNYINTSAYVKLKEFFVYELKVPLKSTDKKTLEEARGKFPESAGIVNLVLDIKSTRKLKETYLDPQLGHDNRFHYILKASTETGRLASQQDPLGFGANIQTIPDGICRRWIIADPGMTLIYADLAQAEARIVAYLSNCRRLIQMFNDADRPGKCDCGSGLAGSKCCYDVHKVNAGFILQKLPRDITKEERQIGKKVRHARNYMMGPKTFSRTTGLPVLMCKKLLRADSRTYPEIPRWWKGIEAEIRSTRMLRNPFDRIRFFFGRVWDHKTLREACAQIPQSTVPDIVNLAYISIQEAGVPVLMQGHDALLCQARDEELEEVAMFVKEELEIPFEINGREITIPVDVEVGKCWDSAEMFSLGNWREHQCG